MENRTRFDATPKTKFLYFFTSFDINFFLCYKSVVIIRGYNQGQDTAEK
jgi:hypothetical protein